MFQTFTERIPFRVEADVFLETFWKNFDYRSLVKNLLVEKSSRDGPRKCFDTNSTNRD